MLRRKSNRSWVVARHRLLVMALLLLSASAHKPLQSQQSLSEPPSQEIRLDNDGGVPMVVPVETPEAAITGELLYPNALVLTNLGLSSLIDAQIEDTFRVQTSQQLGNQGGLRSEIFELENLNGRRILSLGEGFSGLVPYLRRQGAEAYGLDLWYDPSTPIPEGGINSDFMRSYREKYEYCLVQGDATDLCGFEDQAFDMVLSHKLLGYLTQDQQKSMITESVRLLRPGGSVHFNLASDWVEVAAQEQLLEHLSDQGFEVDISVVEFEVEIELRKARPRACALVESFSERELGGIPGALQLVDRASQILYPLTNRNSLLVVKRRNGKAVDWNLEPDKKVEEILHEFQERGVASLSEFNSFLKRQEASGVRFSDSSSGLKAWINQLASQSGKAALHSCYGFVPMWIEMGEGRDDRERLESGLSKWRAALRGGEAVKWPAQSLCSSIQATLNLETGKVSVD